MPDFWKTKFTMEAGKGMGALSPGHLLWLALTLFLFMYLGSRYKAMDESRRKGLRWTVSILILIDEAAKDIVFPATGQWEWAFLPLHVCSVSVFIVFLHALTGSALLSEYLYAVTLPTALMALVFPDWTGVLPFLNFECFHSFSIHMLLALYPVMLCRGGFRPSWGRLRLLIAPIAVYWVAMYFVNNALGTNFAFVNGGASGNPLAVLEGYIGPWYRLAFPAIAAAVWLPMYLIPAALEKRRK